MKKTKWFAVVNDTGRTFCGMSELSGNAMWLVVGDFENCGGEVLKRRRDSRWLALALKSDPTARWKEV